MLGMGGHVACTPHPKGPLFEDWGHSRNPNQSETQLKQNPVSDTTSEANRHEQSSQLEIDPLSLAWPTLFFRARHTSLMKKGDRTLILQNSLYPVFCAWA